MLTRQPTSSARLGAALAKGTGHAEVSHCLFGICGTQRDFMKFHIVDRGWPLMWNHY